MVKIQRFDESPVTNLSQERGNLIRLVNEEMGAKNLNISYFTLKPKAPWGAYHYHEKAESVSIILSGRAKLVVDGIEYEVGPNTVIFIPPGERHEIAPIGDEELKKIDIYSPPRGSDVKEIPWDGGLPPTTSMK
tara:strand:+ start:232 stop:633 length:402 start_codon:yes stop_codon:yes gene_type:complete